MATNLNFRQILLSLIFTVLAPLANAEVRDYQRASGAAPGDLNWEIYFTMPLCQHKGKKENVWCNFDNYRDSEIANGVVEKLTTLIGETSTNAIYMSYFSFSNSAVIKALCIESGKRPSLQVNLFLDVSNVGATTEKINKVEGQLQEKFDWYKPGCADRFKVHGRAAGHTEFIQHSKIFMTLEKPLPKADQLNTWVQQENRVKFSSSSANMSGPGPTINFENWIFFDAPATDYVAQQNVCTMIAFTAVEGSAVERERANFKDVYQKCVGSVISAARPDLNYYIVPSVENNQGQGPQRAFQDMIYQAKTSVHLGIHRYTTKSLAYPIVKAKDRGLDVKVIMDDDTLMAGVENPGSSVIDLGGADVLVSQYLQENDVDIHFMETNPDMDGFGSQLFHNKFVIVDGEKVFQGAGNFTSRALNTFETDGNYEQFYVIAIPELAQAFEKAYAHLYDLATPRSEHPVGDHADLCVEDFNVVPCEQ